jgi:hypothetical protein
MPNPNRRHLQLALTSLAFVGVRARAQTSLERTPPADRQVGIAYSAWHDRLPWAKTWDVPELGPYLSNDGEVIAQHAAWLSDANVDFIYVDWSNNLNTGVPGKPDQPRQRFIESATGTLFDVYARLPRHPKIALMIGFPGEAAGLEDGRLKRKADQVWTEFAANPAYQSLCFHYLGHPLLLVYVGTPSPFGAGPPSWLDPRFTVRFMTGFVSQQPGLLAPGSVSRFGYWSWEDRGAPTVAVYRGQAEAMTIVAAWRGDGRNGIPPQGRRNGQTFIESWSRARRIGPRFALAGTFNEWANPSEEPSAEVSKDLEPSRIFGRKYLDILKTEAAAFKAGIDR